MIFLKSNHYQAVVCNDQSFPRKIYDQMRIEDKIKLDPIFLEDDLT